MKFEDYYRKIGIHHELFLRLDTLYLSVSRLFPEEIERPFVSHDNLWFFSKNYALCVTGWTRENPEMDLLPLNIQSLNLQPVNYDFKKATDKSNLWVSIKFKGEPSDRHHDIKKLIAFHANCDELVDILKKYLVPKERI